MLKQKTKEEQMKTKKLWSTSIKMKITAIKLISTTIARSMFNTIKCTQLNAIHQLHRRISLLFKLQVISGSLNPPDQKNKPRLTPSSSIYFLVSTFATPIVTPPYQMGFSNQSSSMKKPMLNLFRKRASKKDMFNIFLIGIAKGVNNRK